jgi:hypothetical protein
MVSVLASELKVHGFKPSKRDGFLRAKKFTAHLPSYRK